MKKKVNQKKRLRTIIFISIAIILLIGILLIMVNNGNPKVLIKTSKGDITLELYSEKAPITVENFLTYVNESFYEGTVFHRIIPNFMVQGGGFDKTGSEKVTHNAIKLESDKGLSNEKGTIAMARTMVQDSATSQFFINLNDNDFLNSGTRDAGYAVFGKVIKGIEIIEEMGKVQTTTKNGMDDWPVEEIIIESIELLA